MNKRKDFPDSVIMDALDACGYNIKLTSKRLGVEANTLYRWIMASSNLSKYIKMRLEVDGLKARDKLEEMLELLDPSDPRFTSNVIQVCKILLDKAESDKTVQDINLSADISIDPELQSKIDKLLEE